jgi:hypothetical protein
MAKKKKEEPAVDNTVEKLKVKKTKIKKFESKEDTVKVDLSKEKQEVKEDVTRVDLNEKPEENKINEKEVVEDSKQTEPEQKQEEVKEQEAPVLEEITEDSTEKEIEEVEEKVEEAIAEAKTTGEPLPENVERLVEFMKETGGDINDYVKLNKDYSKLNDNDVLYEYYKQTKPHLTTEEINFLMEDSFSYDEEVDEERDIKRKKLALKEQVASAKAHLDGQKSKYYRNIKAGSKLTKEQQKAVNFFNRYNKESEETNKIAKQNSEIFTQKTNQVFNDKFKGFEYNVGDKKYRFNVSNANEVKNTQSDLNNFTKKFLDKKMALKDAAGYHKSLYTAMNADAVAKHFYEQGKADAMKESIAKSKNVDMNPRQSHGVVESGGIKVRVLGNDSSDFKFKIKNNK